MKESNNYSSEINADLSYPRMSHKGSINKNCSSYIIPSSRDKNLYKKFELFLSKNKFHLNNDYDKNNAQIFLKEKNQVLANIDLDDYIEGEEEEKTVIDKGNSTYIKNHINTNIKKNNISTATQKISINNTVSEQKNVSNKNNNKQENLKGNNQNQSFDGVMTGCPPGSLFDTGKADLLCLLLGMSNK